LSAGLEQRIDILAASQTCQQLQCIRLRHRGQKPDELFLSLNSLLQRFERCFQTSGRVVIGFSDIMTLLVAVDTSLT
jgi:hypothetical protein